MRKFGKIGFSGVVGIKGKSFLANMGKEYPFRPYQELKEKKIAVRAENYEQVFHTGILPGDTAETIWRRFLRQPPKTFRGYHSLSTSDVIVINKEGAITSFMWIVSGWWKCRILSA